MPSHATRLNYPDGAGPVVMLFSITDEDGSLQMWRHVNLEAVPVERRHLAMLLEAQAAQLRAEAEEIDAHDLH